MSKIILLDNTNFIDFPIGGTLSFDKQLLHVLGAEMISLVGITTDPHVRVGKWTKLVIEDMHFDFFPIMYLPNNDNRPVIPLRLKSFLSLFRRINKIRIGNEKVFTQTPQFLFVLKWFRWKKLCFCFAGLGNSVKLSRYVFLRFLGGIYERALFSVLKKKVDVIVAAADQKTISEFVLESRGMLDNKTIRSFPTRFNNQIFKPLDKLECRKRLHLPLNKRIIVIVGRLSWIKGWSLAIEMMRQDNMDNSILIFVGDGEDRSQIEKEAATLIELKRLLLTGILSPENVSLYLNAADVSLIVSYKEGWSTSIVESIACGIPVVSTEVSSARDLIIEGQNGFILSGRDPCQLSKLVQKSFALENAQEVSLRIARRFSIETLKSDFLTFFE